ncbi:hypothetical protein ACFSS8_08390 [Paracoccus kondratievae]
MRRKIDSGLVTHNIATLTISVTSATRPIPPHGRLPHPWTRPRQ